jgi:pimeloyl-ACP methyl ester carboxylesterase
MYAHPAKERRKAVLLDRSEAPSPAEISPMHRLISGLFLSLLLTLFVLPQCSLAATTAPIEGFVSANGKRLQYLDWGQNGPVLILIHGLGDNAHQFDDLAPAFTDRFHVIAYSRRGAGGSEAGGPYDVDTLTEDLRLLMDALGVKKANLVGMSAGGNEVTEMAAKYPDRVSRIIYLDAGYDWADPGFEAAYKAIPFTAFAIPADAMSSWDAYRTYQKTIWFPQLDDMRRVEASLREDVIIQPDQTLKPRTPDGVLEGGYEALRANKPRDYTHVHAPVLSMRRFLNTPE